MPPNQPELWCAEPHPVPHLYPQLNPQQQARLIHHMAFLMLKQFRQQPNPELPKLPSTPLKPHKR